MYINILTIYICQRYLGALISKQLVLYTGVVYFSVFLPQSSRREMSSPWQRFFMAITVGGCEVKTALLVCNSKSWKEDNSEKHQEVEKDLLVHCQIRMTCHMKFKLVPVLSYTCGQENHTAKHFLCTDAARQC